MVGKIALGVFLGNLAFALLAWFVIGMRLADDRTSRELIDAAASYNSAIAGSTSPTPR